MIKLVINEIPNPYIDRLASLDDLWGEYSILHIEKGKQEVIIYIQWDILPFISWFLESITDLRTEELTYPDSSKIEDLNNIRHHIDILSEKEFDIALEDMSDNDEEFLWFKNIEDYIAHHNLYMGLMGSKLQGVFIGIVDGMGTISWKDESGSYLNFEIDIDNMLADITHQLLSILENHAADKFLKREEIHLMNELLNKLNTIDRGYSIKN